MWELTARFDYLTGRRINQTLQAMIAGLRQEPGDASRSYPQRAADALAHFDAKWANLALGTARNASDAQKLVLAARDGGCISCGAHSEETHAHHIRFWSDDGPTEIPNLASLCPRCHNLIHDHNWEVQVQADGHPKLRPPDHLRLPPEVPSVGALAQAARKRAPDYARLPANPSAQTNPILGT